MAVVEQARHRMEEDQSMLDSWDRPWLGRSTELQERLKLDAADERFTIGISVQDAVKASRKVPDCQALFALTRALRSQVVVEIGTNVGISGGYIAAALKVNGDGGALTTLEGAPSKADLAKSNLREMGLSEHSAVVVGDFAETFGQVLEQVSRVDLAFIDGFHDGPATVGYHHQIKPHVAPGAVLVYDDIGWSDGMRVAWDSIKKDPDVSVAVAVRGVGYCVMS